MENKKQSGFGIAGLALGLIGMCTTCVFFGIFPCIIGLIFSIIGLFCKNRKKGAAIAGMICSLIGVLIFGVIVVVVNSPDEIEEPQVVIEETISDSIPDSDEEIVEMPETSEEIESEAEESTEDVVEAIEESEEEYKARCEEMYYDEVFFSNDIYVGKYVKLHLFLSEKYFFTSDDLLYNDTAKSLYNDNNLYRDFYKCCVLREGTNSYVGQQVDVFFSQDFEWNPSDYESGQKVVMYGQIIDYATDTWSGYNSVYFIPRYIEKEE